MPEGLSREEKIKQISCSGGYQTWSLDLKDGRDLLVRDTTLAGGKITVFDLGDDKNCFLEKDGRWSIPVAGGDEMLPEGHPAIQHQEDGRAINEKTMKEAGRRLSTIMEDGRKW